MPPLAVSFIRTMKKIEILDTTLREGAQSEQISFSAADKLHIAEALDAFGIPLIEGGNPASNPTDREFFAKCKLKNAALVAFTGTHRKELSPERDPGFAAVLEAGAPIVTVFGKCSREQAECVLGTEPEHNLEMIRASAAWFVQQGKRVIFDAEHFFDGYRSDSEYALAALRAAAEGGADTLCLCDTNGATFPDEIGEITEIIVRAFPSGKVGIHCHNDAGFADAGAYFAVKAGARHVQGTFTGFGERCGNSSLSTVIPNLQLKKGYSLIPPENMKLLTQTAIRISDVMNVSLRPGQPYVGRSAFAHKAGMHADAVRKQSSTFEHVGPESVGNVRRFLLSEVSGRSVIAEKIAGLYPHLTKDSPETAAVLEHLKDMEHRGYRFEAAEASFLLAVKRRLHDFRPSFELVSYKAINEQPAVENVPSTAIVKVRVGGQPCLASGEGNGPVNALDRALRNALSAFYPEIAEMSLTDYKVRVLTPEKATAAVVRVLITSTDGTHIWSTVGVSSDVIDASFIALTDSIEYKLLLKEQ